MDKDAGRKKRSGGTSAVQISQVWTQYRQHRGRDQPGRNWPACTGAHRTEDALTVDTVILTSLLHPNTPVKSLATPLKLIDLATEGNTCHVFDVLLTILSNGGKYLDGEVVDSILLNTGPEELVDAGGMV